jgi:hypothetical protein
VVGATGIALQRLGFEVGDKFRFEPLESRIDVLAQCL